MPDQNLTTWHPPQEKLVHRGFIAVAAIAAVTVGATLIHMFVPTLVDAVNLLQKLLASMTSMLITGAVLVALIWLLWETFSPTGKINGLFAQAYSSFIHSLTLQLLDVDPMSPLKDSLAAVKAKKTEYDEQFARFDGQISNFKSQENNARAIAAKAEKDAKEAYRIVQSLANSEDPNDIARRTDMNNRFTQLGYQAGAQNELANDLAGMQARLVPVRSVILRLQSYCTDMIGKLETDIQITQIRWDASNSLSATERAARGMLKDSGKTELAQEAQNLVNTKYATAIGRLENLGDLAKPLLDTADLEKGSYSQDLLAKWQAEDNATAHPQIAMAQPMPMITASVSPSFADLIKK